MQLQRLSRTAAISGALLSGILLASPSQAYFLDIDSPRAAGMGEAFVSVADDANSLLYNPAGLAGLQEIELAAMYADLFTSVNAGLYTGEAAGFGSHFIAAAGPIPQIRSAVGVSWLRFSSAWYQENIWSVAYAGRLLPANATPWGLSLDAGVAGKSLNWSLAGGDYAEAEWKTGFTLAAGLLATWREWRLGFSGDNLIPVSMNLDDTSETVPVLWRTGLAYQLPWPSTTTATVEFTSRDQVRRVKAGVESWVNDTVALRLGGNYESLACGASVNFRKLGGSSFSGRLDYAFTLPLIVRNTLGSHRMGLDLRWDEKYHQQQKENARKNIEAKNAAEAQRQKDALSRLQTASKLAQIAAGAAETCEALARSLSAWPTRPGNADLLAFSRQAQTDLAGAANDLTQATASLQKKAQADVTEAQGWKISEDVKQKLSQELQQINQQAERAAATQTRLASLEFKLSTPGNGQGQAAVDLSQPLENVERELEQRISELSQATEKSQSALDQIQEKIGSLPAILEQGAAEAAAYGLDKELALQAAATCRRVLLDLKGRGDRGLSAWRSLGRDLQGQNADCQKAKDFLINRRDPIVVAYLREQLSDIGMAKETQPWAEALARQAESRLHLKITLLPYSDSSALLRDFRKGDLELVLVSSKAAGQLARDGVADGFLTVKSNGRFAQPQRLFVREDSGIQQLADLKGRTLGYMSDDVLNRLEIGFSADISGYMPATFFKLKKRLPSCFSAIVALQMSDVDVIAGPEYLKFLFDHHRPLFPHGMTMLSYPRLGAMPHPVLAARSLMRQSKWNKTAKLAAYLEQLHETPDGKAALDTVNADQIVPWKNNSEHADGNNP